MRKSIPTTIAFALIAAVSFFLFRSDCLVSNVGAQENIVINDLNVRPSSGYIPAPVKVKLKLQESEIILGKPFPGADNFFQNLKLTLANTSDKEINSIRFMLWIHAVGDPSNKIGVPIDFPSKEIFTPAPTTPTVLLKPGETITVEARAGQDQDPFIAASRFFTPDRKSIGFETSYITFNGNQAWENGIIRSRR
jgi:hypothetical protein